MNNKTKAGKQLNGNNAKKAFHIPMKLAAHVLQSQPWCGHLQVTQPAAVPPKEEQAGALFPLLPIATTMAPVINSRNCNI